MRINSERTPTNSNASMTRIHPSFKKLLMVDESGGRSGIGKFLRLQGIRVWFATSEEEALMVAAREEPHVAILDAGKVSAAALSEALLERVPNLDIVLMTPRGDIGAIIAAMRAGAADVLTMPLELDDVLTTLKRLEGRRSRRQRVSPTAHLSLVPTPHQQQPSEIELDELTAQLTAIRVEALELCKGGAVANTSIDPSRSGRAILRAVKRIGVAVDKLTNGTAQTQRLELAAPPEPLDLRELFAKVSDLRPSAHRRGVDLRFTSWTAGRASLEHSGHHVSRTLASLVTKTVENAERGTTITVSSTFDRTGVKLVINGESARPVEEALRLGPALPILNEIAASLGGEIQVERTPTQGITFQVAFPLGEKSENRLGGSAAAEDSTDYRKAG